MNFEDWELVCLEEVAEELTVGFVGSMASEYVEQGIPFFRSLNIEPFRINKQDLKYISKEFHAKLKKSSLHPGDVVIVRTGKPGACLVVPEWVTEANCSDLVIIRPGKKIDSHYLSYYVNSVATGHVNAHLVGAVQQHFNVSSARSMKIMLPSIEEQKAITSILNAINDKIEINNRINKTLEEMAQALFKQWFVDFEFPDENGQPYKSSGGEMEESELGPVPMGWKVVDFEDVFDFQEGPGIRNWQYVTENGTKFINIRCIKNNDLQLNTASMISNEEANGKYSHFMLKEWDVVVSTSGTLGRYAIVRKEHLPLCLNTSVIRFSPKAQFECFSFMFGYLTSVEFYKHLISKACGSVQANFGPMHLHQIKLVFPAEQILHKYHSDVFPLIKKCVQIRSENQKLSTLRDALLPKLMSGEIRVPIEEVAAHV